MPLEPEPQLAAKTLVRMLLTEGDDVGFDLALQRVGLSLVGGRCGRGCPGGRRGRRRGRCLAFGEKAQRGNVDAAFRATDQEVGGIPRRCCCCEQTCCREEPDRTGDDLASRLDQRGVQRFRGWGLRSHTRRLSCWLACPQAATRTGTSNRRY